MNKAIELKRENIIMTWGDLPRAIFNLFIGCFKAIDEAAVLCGKIAKLIKLGVTTLIYAFGIATMVLLVYIYLHGALNIDLSYISKNELHAFKLK